MRASPLSVLGCLLIVFGTSSCKKSYKAIVKERSETIDAFALELKELKNSLPEVDARKVADFPPIPEKDLPYFHIKDDDSNTIIVLTDVMADFRMLDPPNEGNHFDFPGSGVSTLQKIAHPEKGKDSGWFANRVDRLLGARYLLVLDVKQVVPIEIVDEESFTGGNLQMNAHFYDRERKQWLTNFPIDAIPKIGYAFDTAKNVQRKLAYDISVEAKNEAAKMIDAELSESVGGLYEFDYDAPGLDGQPVPWPTI